jgi:hypothetical protein
VIGLQKLSVVQILDRRIPLFSIFEGNEAKHISGTGADLHIEKIPILNKKFPYSF